MISSRQIIFQTWKYSAEYKDQCESEKQLLKSFPSSKRFMAHDESNVAQEMTNDNDSEGFKLTKIWLLSECIVLGVSLSILNFKTEFMALYFRVWKNYNLFGKQNLCGVKMRGVYIQFLIIISAFFS